MASDGRKTLRGPPWGRWHTRNANMHTPPPHGYLDATAKFVSNYAELRLPISLWQCVRVKLDVVMNSMWYLCGLQPRTHIAPLRSVHCAAVQDAARLTSQMKRCNRAAI
jgi:hypothetical protein